MDNSVQNSIDFIKNDLIPEMVHNRSFCDTGSREFVELDSVHVETCKKSEKNNTYELYRGKVVIKFSSVPKIFNIIIKLLPLNGEYNDGIFNCFLNEEIFYNKMTAQYQLDIYPKCYGADLGRYGRPVIVLDDLEADGFIQSAGKLDGDHLTVCLKAISAFHARGFKLKCEKFETFREFYVKLGETFIKNDYHVESINKLLKYLSNKDKKNSQIIEEIEKILKHLPAVLNSEINDCYTICHGNLDKNNLFFRYDENKKPVEIKIIGWNHLKYSLPGIDLQFVNFLQSDDDNKLNNEIIHFTLVEQFKDYVRVLNNECPNLSLLQESLQQDFVLSIIYPYIFSTIF